MSNSTIDKIIKSTTVFSAGLIIGGFGATLLNKIQYETDKKDRLVLAKKVAKSFDVLYGTLDKCRKRELETDQYYSTKETLELRGAISQGLAYCSFEKSLLNNLIKEYED